MRTGRIDARENPLAMMDAFGIYDRIDPAAFRRRLSGVDATWKERLGTRCWSLLEAEAGALA
jgi:hypothetical protein